jgi:hypothetical protein
MRLAHKALYNDVSRDGERVTMATVQGYARFFGRLVLRVLLVSVVILAIASAYCLSTGGWTVLRFVDTASTLGLVTTALGALSGVGSAQLGSNATYQVARTAGAASGGDRASQDFHDSEKRIGFTWLMAGGGLMAILTVHAIRLILLP